MSDRQYPLISVLIRSMARPYLAEALASVAAQTWPEVEVLVLNASGESHPVLPADFPFPLRLLDSGTAVQRSDAANRLLEQAGGRWALLLDDDDWLAPEHLARLAAALEEHPASVLAYAGIACVEVDAEAPGQPHEVRRFDMDFDPLRLLLENYIPMHAALFDLERVRAGAGLHFDPAFDLFEDWDFWLQCLERGSFTHVAGVSAWYRIHSQSGVGVRIDQAARADAALDHLIAKWRGRWSAEQLHQMIGLARQVYPLQHALQDEQERVRQLRVDHAENIAALEQNLVEIKASHRREIAELRQHLTALYEGSLSWRLTRPLRAAASLLRGLGVRLRNMLGAVRKVFFRSLLDLVTALYRAPLLASLAHLVPSSFKRRVRNFLFYKSFGAGTTVTTGIVVERDLGAAPLVSIVIPVYNHAAYLEQCIRSALQQTWENLEVVVVDDASPDAAVQPILDALEGLPRLKIVRLTENVGISQAQNSAMMASRGAVIAFLDCDDYLDPAAIALCMQHWRGDTVYMHTGRINVDEQGQELNRINFVELPRRDYFEENLRAMYATHLKLVRRDVFARVGLFDARFDAAQDYEMLMRVAFHYPSSSFVHVPEFVYSHRIHERQTTETQRERQNALTGQIQKEARLRRSIRDGSYARFVSIVMLSYGKHSQTLAAIQGLEDTVHIPHEIILYDNGSAQETVEFLKTRIDGHFANVRVFYGERNLGPAQGRRVALEHARGEWVIIFDNDELPEHGWLEELLLRAEVNENVGAVCCRVVFPDGRLQFSGGGVAALRSGFIELSLNDNGKPYDDLSTCVFREVEWCPIGATLFTRNIAPYLHGGYPNTFEDAGVSFALRKEGLRLLNAPGALVWHDHVTYRPAVEMGEQYMRDRYNPRMMLKSVASFFDENGLIIHDEYIWRENSLYGLSHDELLDRLRDARAQETGFERERALLG